MSRSASALLPLEAPMRAAVGDGPLHPVVGHPGHADLDGAEGQQAEEREHERQLQERGPAVARPVTGLGTS